MNYAFGHIQELIKQLSKRFILVLISFTKEVSIRKTCPCNVYPLIPHYSKFGVCRGIPIFLIFAPKHLIVGTR